MFLTHTNADSSLSCSFWGGTAACQAAQSRRQIYMPTQRNKCVWICDLSLILIPPAFFVFLYHRVSATASAHLLPIRHRLHLWFSNKGNPIHRKNTTALYKLSCQDETGLIVAGFSFSASHTIKLLKVDWGVVTELNDKTEWELPLCLCCSSASMNSDANMEYLLARLCGAVFEKWDCAGRKG